MCRPNGSGVESVYRLRLVKHHDGEWSLNFIRYAADTTPAGHGFYEHLGVAELLDVLAAELFEATEPAGTEQPPF